MIISVETEKAFNKIQHPFMIKYPPEGGEEKEPSYTVSGNANQYSHCGEQCRDSLKNQKQNYHTTQQSHCWAYTLRKQELKEMCTPMFIAALFTIASTWKQPRCPSTEEWIKMWSIYAVNYYSAIKGTRLCHLQRHGWTQRVQ